MVDSQELASQALEEQVELSSKDKRRDLCSSINAKILKSIQAQMTFLTQQKG